VIISFVILFTLNYFEILPLSTTFPKYFGFLPQISKNIRQAIYAPTPVPTATPIIWDKQANPTLISNYSDYFKIHNMPPNPYGQTTDMFLVSGTFTAYNNNYIQTITSNGLTIFQITNNTTFRKLSPAITDKSQGGNGADRITTMYKNSADFYSDTPFGSYLQITYRLNGDIKVAADVDYYPEYKY
jgi:hypothetical protein